MQESKADDATRQLLEQLLNEIKALNAKVPESQAVSDMSEETENIINESRRDAPRQRWYQASLEGIKEAATTLGAIAKPVFAVAEKLTPLLMG